MQDFIHSVILQIFVLPEKSKVGKVSVLRSSPVWAPDVKQSLRPAYVGGSAMVLVQGGGILGRSEDDCDITFLSLSRCNAGNALNSGIAE